MEPCKFRACRNVVPVRQKCWQCGKHYCKEHLKLHDRCRRYMLCPKRQCWKEHEAECPKYEPFRGSLRVDKTIGNGSESVYIWYNKAQFDGAKRRKETCWPCKIGRTKSSPTARIFNQGALTAFSEVPIVPLVLRTNESVSLEAMIQNSLRYAGKRIMRFRGTEWFQTNPSEVERVYRTLTRLTKGLRDPDA